MCVSDLIEESLSLDLLDGHLLISLCGPRLVYSSFLSCLPWHSATAQIVPPFSQCHARSLAEMCIELHCIGLYRDVWIAAIASSRTSLATLTVVMCNTVIRHNANYVRYA